MEKEIKNLTFKCETCGYASDEPEDFIRHAQKEGCFCNNCPKEKEINLSEKIEEIKNSDWCKVGTKDQQEGRKGGLDRASNEFKEFIKRLKEELWGGSFMLTENEQIDKLDKLAGDKLI